jgi:hypothetical protein
MRPPAVKPSQFKRWIHFALAYVALLFLSLILSLRLVQRADYYLRETCQDTAEMAAQTLPLSDIRALTGSPKDLESPRYARLKAQFEAFQKMLPGCRFAYLLGRRPDGQLFFFLDGEPADSPDYSPPGQLFTEAAPGFHKVFESGASRVIVPPPTDGGHGFQLWRR